MIFGFGAIEEKTARAIIDECATALAKNRESPEKEVEKIKGKYSDLDNKYKPMDKNDVPERYSYFFYTFYELYPGNYVVKFSFHHINRRHPFSLDGWALLQTEWMLALDEYGTMIYKQT